MYVAIDIGGTDLKYAIIDKQLKLIEHHIIPTAKENLTVQITKQIEAILHDIKRKKVEIDGIGISTAGVVNSKTGEIIYAGPTMPTYVGTNLKRFIVDNFHIPTSIINDVNAAAIGEKWLGGAQSYSHFLCITIGTGIGGAVFINNELYAGKYFRAGEIGHIPFRNNERLSYEQVASMSALLDRARQEFQFNGKGKQLFELAKQGNLLANTLIDSWIKDLCSGLIPVLCTIDVEAIIIGGAVSQQGDFLINKVKSQLVELLPPSLIMPSIKAALLGNNAALYGAIHPFFKS